MREWRPFVPAVVMALAALVTTAGGERVAMPLAAPLATLPIELAGYRGSDVALPASDVHVAGVSRYLLRQFRRDTAMAFSVYVGYYEAQARGRTMHSPRNCLPGAGWTELQAAEREIVVAGQPVRVNRYLVSHEGSWALVYYWYQGRGRVVASEYRVKWNLLLDNVRWHRSDESLVRIVIPVDRHEHDALDEADALAQRLTAELVPGVARVLPAPP